MSDLAGVGVTHLVDAVDTASSLAVASVKATVGVAEKSVEGVVHLGEVTADQALAEVERLRTEFVAALRKVATQAADAVPVG